MFVACGIWCLADVSSVSPSSEQTHIFSVLAHAEKQLFSKLVFGNFWSVKHRMIIYHIVTILSCLCLIQLEELNGQKVIE